MGCGLAGWAVLAVAAQRMGRPPVSTHAGCTQAAASLAADCESSLPFALSLEPGGSWCAA